jgi:Tol biopolymer transport system component
MTTGTTTRASVSSAGAQANGGASQFPVISADGRLIVFQSSATNLVAGDTNAQQDVFVHDMTSGVTTLVSVSSAGVQANQLCSEQAISADGRYVGFSSFASTLLIGDDNGLTDVFVRDLANNITTRVSVSSAGVQANQASFHPVLSQDGRYVAFTSNASNLVANDVAGFRDVFVRDRSSNTTTRESVSTAGAEANNASTLESISGDGRYLSFSSLASNLVPPDTNGFEDIFVRDRSSGTTALVSMSAAGVRTDNTSTQPTISADGHFIGFYSMATNLVPNDNNGVQDIFVVANSLKP